MKEYSIHYHIDMGYRINICAETEHEAKLKAEQLFQETDVSDFEYIDSDCEVVDCNKCVRGKG